MNIIHFATPEQVDALRQVFTRAEPTRVLWPCADDEWMEETIEWNGPAWLDVMDSFCVPSNWR